MSDEPQASAKNVFAEPRLAALHRAAHETAVPPERDA